MASHQHCCGVSFWLYIMIIVGLVLFAGLMSGLTLGLMSLGLVDLEVLMRSGTPADRKHAGNPFLLVSEVAKWTSGICKRKFGFQTMHFEVSMSWFLKSVNNCKLCLLSSENSEWFLIQESNIIWRHPLWISKFRLIACMRTSLHGPHLTNCTICNLQLTVATVNTRTPYSRDIQILLGPVSWVTSFTFPQPIHVTNELTWRTTEPAYRFEL